MELSLLQDVIEEKDDRVNPYARGDRLSRQPQGDGGMVITKHWMDARLASHTVLIAGRKTASYSTFITKYCRVTRVPVLTVKMNFRLCARHSSRLLMWPDQAHSGDSW